MSLKKLLLSSALLLFSALLFSQVEVIGKLRLGDTTQTHVILTKKGDRLVGRLTAFDGSKIEFEMLGNRLSFPLSELLKIIVNDPENPYGIIEGMASNTPISYQLKTTNGKIYDGNFLGYGQGDILMATEELGRVNLNTNSIESFRANGQEQLLMDSIPPVFQVLHQTNGESMEGFVTGYENRKWNFMDFKGRKITLDKRLVESIEVVAQGEQNFGRLSLTHRLNKSRDWGDFTRNFVAPTGFMLKKGEGEYRNTEIIFNNVDYGLSDYVTVGAGVATIFYQNSLSGRIKIGASIAPKFHVAVGGQAFYILTLNDDPSTITSFYGAATVGGSRAHLTLSAGRVRDMYDDVYSTLTMAGSVKVGKRHRIFLEYNQIMDIESNYNTLLLNAGVGWFKDSNRLDFGFTVAGEDGYYVPFPIGAYSFYF